MEGLHILQIDKKITDVIQVDAHGGLKVLKESDWSTHKAATHRIAWRWGLMEEINEALQWRHV